MRKVSLLKPQGVCASNQRWMVEPTHQPAPTSLLAPLRRFTRFFKLFKSFFFFSWFFFADLDAGRDF